MKDRSRNKIGKSRVTKAYEVILTSFVLFLKMPKSDDHPTKSL